VITKMNKDCIQCYFYDPDNEHCDIPMEEHTENDCINGIKAFKELNDKIERAIENEDDSENG